MRKNKSKTNMLEAILIGLHLMKNKELVKKMTPGDENETPFNETIEAGLKMLEKHNLFSPEEIKRIKESEMPNTALANALYIFPERQNKMKSIKLKEKKESLEAEIQNFYNRLNLKNGAIHKLNIHELYEAEKLYREVASVERQINSCRRFRSNSSEYSYDVEEIRKMRRQKIAVINTMRAKKPLLKMKRSQRARL